MVKRLKYDLNRISTKYNSKVASILAFSGVEMAVFECVLTDEEGCPILPEQSRWSSRGRHFASGAIAGVLSRCLTAPLDRTKVFLQVHGSKDFGMIRAIQHLYREGGVRSFWRGNGVGVMKFTPEVAIKFTVYDELKRLIRDDDRSPMTLKERFLAAALSGITSQTMIYPLEVVKTRLALANTGQYKGISDAIRQLFWNEGPRTFFQGYMANICSIIPLAGIELAAYETLKNMIMSHLKEDEIGVAHMMICAAAATSMSQCFSYPFSLIRAKMQAKVRPKRSEDAMRLVIWRIAKERGVRGFYIGFLPNFLKLTPSVTLTYTVYELVQRLFGVTMR